MHSIPRRLAAATAAAIASLALCTTAQADPGGVPDANDIVGVGSATSQYVIDVAAKAHAATTRRTGGGSRRSTPAFPAARFRRHRTAVPT